MENKRISVRFNERMRMLLDEIADRTGTKLSVVVRCLVAKGIDELLDESGNLKLDEKQVQG